MAKTIKKILIITLILSVFTIPVFAQRTGSLLGGSSSSSSQSNPTLKINCNIRNANVVITTQFYKDGPVASGTAPFTAQLNKGSYIVTVSAPGYEQKQQTINLSNSMSLNFNLGESKASLQIRSNVRDAKVVITGGGLSGQMVGSAPFTAQLSFGRYRISISAPGYLAVTKELNLSSSQTLNINLEQESYNLTVKSNVPGAKVFIRGGTINGQLTGTTDMTSVLPKGRYQVKVNAAGYFAESQTINLTGSTTLNIQLRPRTGKLEVIIPNNILDYSINNPSGRVKIFDNGTELSGTSFELNPGQHTIRITSGGFASQQTINVKAGESYRIELNFGFSLIKQ